MGYVRIDRDSPDLLRLAPGVEYGMASTFAVVLGVISSGVAGLVMASDVFGGMVVLYASLAFFFVAGLLRGRRRVIDVDIRDSAFYLLGRKASDVAVVPFWRVDCLRLAPAPVRTLRSSAVADAAEASSAVRWELDIVLKDKGRIGLDRTTSAKDASALGLLLAERTGLAFDDRSSAGGAFPACKQFEPDDGAVPVEPPPGSMLTCLPDEPAWRWSNSPGSAGLWLLILVTVTLAVTAAIALVRMLSAGVTLSGLVTVVVAAFFTHMAGGRLFRALFGGGWVALRSGRLVAGTHFFMRQYVTWDVPVDDIAGLRVSVPVTGAARLDCVTADGRVLPVVVMTPGLSILTAGDLQWLAARLRILVKQC